MCGQEPGGSDHPHQQASTNRFNVGIEGKSGEVRADTKHLLHLPGDCDRFRQVPGLSCPQENRQPSAFDRTLHATRRTTCLEMATTSRTFGVLGEVGSERQKEDTSSPIPTQGELEIPSGQESSDFHLTGVSTSGSLVVSASPSRGGDIFGTIHLRLPTLHRCLEGGLGSVPQRATEVRTLDRGGVSTPHQPTGDGGCLPRSESVSGVPLRLHHCCHVRQHDSSFLPEQAGGDAFQELMSEHHMSTRLGRPPSDHHQVHLRTRTPKRQGGCSEQEESSSQAGMVPTSTGLRPDLQDMGDTSRGSLRHQLESQTSSLLLANSGPGGPRCRCHDQQLERDVRLRLPADSASESDDQQASGGQSGCHPSGSGLAQPGVVPGPAIPDCRPALGASNVGQAPQAATSTGLPQPTVVPQPSRLEIISRHLQTKGFSQQASEVISAHHRASTSSLYQSKWQLFSNWCDGQQIDPLKVTVPQVAELFLYMYLFNDKGFKMSTIKGYCSAISRVLRYQGTDISNDDEISLLIRSLDLRRPTTMSTVPKWNLAVVLRHLTRPPYEPLNTASPKFLTYKTAFLLGLASAKRIGELHALTKFTSHTEGWTSVTINFDPSFMAKTQDPSDPSTSMSTVTIPSLSHQVSDNLDRTLCPVRALRYYLKYTEQIRGARNRLFLTLLHGSQRDITKTTLSNWIKEVIRSAHAQSDDTDARLVKVSAHELRALATSTLFKHTHSLTAVMGAACWRNHNTFSQFYLRDITRMNDDIMSLGPIVAGQNIIGLPTSINTQTNQ